MVNKVDLSAAPVIVGGVNGSGTRVVAMILQQANFYIGQDHNRAMDNLWFTLLLKRPRWYAQYAQHTDTDSTVQEALHLLTRLMLDETKLSRAEWFNILQAAITYSFENRTNKSVWVLKRLNKILRRHPIDLDEFQGWGWKEPHSHLYLPHLAHFYPGMRYIHTIRHGLDMAYSSDQEQVYKWGWLFDVPPPTASVHEPRTSLQYWIKSNRRALELGEKFLEDRFFSLNFDDLCENPHVEITRLMEFLGVRHANIDELAKLPVVPKSKDRYRDKDIGVFSPQEVAAVRDFGFDV